MGPNQGLGENYCIIYWRLPLLTINYSTNLWGRDLESVPTWSPVPYGPSTYGPSTYGPTPRLSFPNGPFPSQRTSADVCFRIVAFVP